MVIFPDFKDLELNDRPWVEEITGNFKPYSDFNFTSLWTWNTNNELKLSRLHNNLVITLPDYISGQPRLSLLGNNKIDGSFSELLEYASSNKIEPKLKLVPEVSINALEDPSRFLLTEDKDNHDYVLSVEEIASLSGNKYYDKRNLVNRFNKAHPDHTALEIDLKNRVVHEQIKQLFDFWATHSKQSQTESANEKIAINRLLDSSEELKVKGLGVYVDNQLVAFSTYETSHVGFGFISFEKADRKFPGLYAYLNQQTALRLKDLGCRYINFEQDLGLPGLKQAKQLWRPIEYLKKYSVELKK